MISDRRWLFIIYLLQLIVLMLYSRTGINAQNDHADTPPQAATVMPEVTFAKANQAYASGNYEQAIELYRSLLNQGVITASIYYNLGNAYFKLNDWGRCRCAYERALLLAPRDPDLAHNLALLKSKLPEEDPPTGAITKLANLFTVNELTVTWYLFYLLTCTLATIYAFKRKEILLWLSAGSLFLLLVSGSLWWVKYYGQPGSPAVIIAQQAQLKNGPGNEFTDSIVLHSGSLVYVLNSRRDWTEILALGRVKAWIRSPQLEIIQPTLMGDTHGSTPKKQNTPD